MLRYTANVGPMASEDQPVGCAELGQMELHVNIHPSASLEPTSDATTTVALNARLSGTGAAIAIGGMHPQSPASRGTHRGPSSSPAMTTERQPSVSSGAGGMARQNSAAPKKERVKRGR